MKFDDFEYDNIKLSEFDCVVCTFDGLDMETIDSGSQITFNTVSVRNGMKYEITDTQYESCIESTFQICKKPDHKKENEDYYFSVDDIRDIMSWLNRKQYHPFRILGDELSDIYFMASFDVSLLKYGEQVWGFELTMHTDRPFALKKPVTLHFKLAKDEKATIYLESDEEGTFFPGIKITVKEAGGLIIYNTTTQKETYIKNCIENEIITFDYPILTTSVSSHKIQNDFNWEFIQLVNTFHNNKNELTASLSCELEITYSPIVKISI
jgi:hypothetical protein